jgi:hypothetical protein
MLFYNTLTLNSKKIFIGNTIYILLLLLSVAYCSFIINLNADTSIAIAILVVNWCDIFFHMFVYWEIIYHNGQSNHFYRYIYVIIWASFMYTVIATLGRFIPSEAINGTVKNEIGIHTRIISTIYVAITYSAILSIIIVCLLIPCIKQIIPCFKLIQENFKDLNNRINERATQTTLNDNIISLESNINTNINTNIEIIVPAGF